jgi:hypothetical protein
MVVDDGVSTYTDGSWTSVGGQGHELKVPAATFVCLWWWWGGGDMQQAQ